MKEERYWEYILDEERQLEYREFPQRSFWLADPEYAVKLEIRSIDSPIWKEVPWGKRKEIFYRIAFLRK